MQFFQLGFLFNKFGFYSANYGVIFMKKNGSIKNSITFKIMSPERCNSSDRKNNPMLFWVSDLIQMYDWNKGHLKGGNFNIHF